VERCGAGPRGFRIAGIRCPLKSGGTASVGPTETALWTSLQTGDGGGDTSKGATDLSSSPCTLTIHETDELIHAASTQENGAIEDCEEEQAEVRHFFESGAVGTVSRVTGAVTIKQA
jgi:hypothetical protein